MDSLAEKLALIIERGSLAGSRISRGDRERLQGLFDAGILQEVRSGAGVRVFLQDQEALESFIRIQYPSGLYGREEDDLPPRSRAVAERRDAKKANVRAQTTIFMRGFNGCELKAGTQVLPVADWTAKAGLAIIAFDKALEWSFSGVIALVENLEVFWNIETIDSRIELAIYSEGRVGGKVLTWLASSPMEGARLVHFGDYDPVGLDEFLRVREVFPGRAELFIPADLEKLFAKYGKARLLIDSAAILSRLRKCPLEEVRAIVDLMDRHGVGVEHEALLIK